MAEPVIRIHPADDVVIARVQLLGGTRIESEGLTVAGLVPPGHKVAVRAICQGQPVRRYKQVIGIARVDIAPGQHVHSHNLEFGNFARDHAVGEGATPTAYVAELATFQGIVLATASGQATQSERHGYGQNEFVPWQLGAVM